MRSLLLERGDKRITISLSACSQKQGTNSGSSTSKLTFSQLCTAGVDGPLPPWVILRHQRVTRWCPTWALNPTLNRAASMSPKCQ